MNRHQIRLWITAALIGVASVASVLFAHAVGWIERAELQALDLRFRYVAALPEDPRIVIVGIDDGSLDLFGRWPWPRDLQSALISVPAELGATHILVDITWSEPETLRVHLPRHAGVASDPGEITLHEGQRVLPDLELAAAIAKAGNVYLAFHYQQHDLLRADLFHSAVDALAAGDETTALARLNELDRRRQRWNRTAGAFPFERAMLLARMIAALQSDPETTADELSKALEVASDEVEPLHQAALVAALTRRVRAWLDEAPQRWGMAVHELIRPMFRAITDQVFDNDTLIKDALIAALETWLGWLPTVTRSTIALDRVASAALPVEGVAAPTYFTLARAARRCGFVVFNEDSDGVMRWMGLLARHDGHVLEQLAFSAACDVLGVRRDQVRAERGALLLPREAGPDLRVPLAADGRTLTPFLAARHDRGGSYLSVFEHVKAGALAQVHEMRRRIRENEHAVRDWIERTLASDLFPEADAYAVSLAELKRLEAEADDARLDQDAERHAAITRACIELRDRILSHENALRKAEYDDGDPAGILIAALEEEIGPYERANDGLRHELHNVLERLRGHFEGRIVLIGYTATALADMAPTPVDSRAPGVMAHANLLNGLLTGSLMRWLPAWANTLLIITLGAWGIFVTLARRPRAALVVVTATLLLFLAVALGAFRFANLWIALAAPSLALTAAFVSISTFVYIFVDRERRQLSTALSQYTSKQIARQVAENPELCQRAESRVVTAMFTDLKGFTSISERIGAERTQSVLNRCLGCFTVVMLRHDALVNKFMGDGVFAFWNPVINPQPDHARRTCATALELLTELDELKQSASREDGDDVYSELFMRIGIATGQAVVGPCGSDLKWDYTCIGDSVNLAARLESANKFFGTQVLVNGDTYDAVAEEFDFRPLGRVQVKGKSAGVRVFELLARRGQAAADDLAYAARFAAALQHFEQRRWTEAIRAFEQCAADRPGDSAALAFVEASVAYLTQPPPETGIPAIALTEK